MGKIGSCSEGGFELLGCKEAGGNTKRVENVPSGQVQGANESVVRSEFWNITGTEGHIAGMSASKGRLEGKRGAAPGEGDLACTGRSWGAGFISHLPPPRQMGLGASESSSASD